MISFATPHSAIQEIIEIIAICRKRHDNIFSFLDDLSFTISSHFKQIKATFVAGLDFHNPTLHNINIQIFLQLSNFNEKHL